METTSGETWLESARFSRLVRLDGALFITMSLDNQRGVREGSPNGLPSPMVNRQALIFHRGANDHSRLRVYRTWQTHLANQSRDQFWSRALFDRSLQRNAALFSPSLHVVDLIAFSSLLIYSARCRSHPTHVHQIGRDTSLERIAPAADVS